MKTLSQVSRIRSHAYRSTFACRRHSVIAPCHPLDSAERAHGKISHNTSQSREPNSISLGCRWRSVASLSCIMLVASTIILHPANASIGDAVATSLREIAPDWVVVTVLASLPVVELRGAIPVGIALLGLPPWLVYICAVAGNTVIVPLILLSLPPLLKMSEGIPVLYKTLDAFLMRAQRQTEKWDSEDLFLLLAWFVAVPLPGTGAWSGSFVAFVLGMPFGEGVLANFAGVCCAAALVTGLVCMGWAGFWLAVMVLLVLPLARFMTRSLKADPR